MLCKCLGGFQDKLEVSLEAKLWAVPLTECHLSPTHLGHPLCLITACWCHSQPLWLEQHHIFDAKSAAIVTIRSLPGYTETSPSALCLLLSPADKVPHAFPVSLWQRCTPCGTRWEPCWALSTFPYAFRTQSCPEPQGRVGFPCILSATEPCPEGSECVPEAPGNLDSVTGKQKPHSAASAVFLCGSTWCISLLTPRSSKWKMSGYKAHNTHDR